MVKRQGYLPVTSSSQRLESRCAPHRFPRSVCSDLAALHVQHICLTDQEVTLTVSSRRRTACCPMCHKRSGRVHSRFVRQLADTPVATFLVHLELHARRFRCLNPACSRQTFREPLPEVAPRYHRRTRLAALSRSGELRAGRASREPTL